LPTFGPCNRKAHQPIPAEITRPIRGILRAFLCSHRFTLSRRTFSKMLLTSRLIMTGSNRKTIYGEFSRELYDLDGLLEHRVSSYSDEKKRSEPS
jgi:hypothetical protein